MSGYTPVSTGYDAHAAARHGFDMAAAAKRAVDLSIPSDEEMVEDVGGYPQQVPQGIGSGYYGKSSGTDQTQTGHGRRASSSTEANRHDPLYRAGRGKSPENVPAGNWTSPLINSTHTAPGMPESRDKTLPHTPPRSHVPAREDKTSHGTGPHIGDSPPKNVSAREQELFNKWRNTFCEYAATRNEEIMERARAACEKYKVGVDEAADEREFLIRNQSEIELN